MCLIYKYIHFFLISGSSYREYLSVYDISDYSSSLEIEAKCSFETVVNIRHTRRHISKDSNLHLLTDQVGRSFSASDSSPKWR
jgi:hypothetical protein